MNSNFLCIHCNVIWTQDTWMNLRSNQKFCGKVLFFSWNRGQPTLIENQDGNIEEKCSCAVKLIEIYVHACMFESTHLLRLQHRFHSENLKYLFALPILLNALLFTGIIGNWFVERLQISTKSTISRCYGNYVVSTNFEPNENFISPTKKQTTRSLIRTNPPTIFIWYERERETYSTIWIWFEVNWRFYLELNIINFHWEHKLQDIFSESHLILLLFALSP